MSTKMEHPSRLGQDTKERLKSLRPDVNGVLDEIVGNREPKPQDSNAVKPAVAVVPEARQPLNPARAEPDGTADAEKAMGTGDFVRMPFNFTRNQLIALEMLKAKMYEMSGKSIDKSTLAREAFDLLFQKYQGLLAHFGSSSASRG